MSASWLRLSRSNVLPVCHRQTPAPASVGKVSAILRLFDYSSAGDKLAARL